MDQNDFLMDIKVGPKCYKSFRIAHTTNLPKWIRLLNRKNISWIRKNGSINEFTEMISDGIN